MTRKELRKKYIGRYLVRRKRHESTDIYKITNLVYDSRLKEYILEAVVLNFQPNYSDPIACASINREKSVSCQLYVSGLRRAKIKFCSKKWVKTMCDEVKKMIDEFSGVA